MNWNERFQTKIQRLYDYQYPMRSLRAALAIVVTKETLPCGHTFYSPKEVRGALPAYFPVSCELCHTYTIATIQRGAPIHFYTTRDEVDGAITYAGYAVPNHVTKNGAWYKQERKNNEL